MLFPLHGFDSPKQAIERLVHPLVAQNFIGRADRLKLGQGRAEFDLAHHALPGENGSHGSELKVQRQDLVRDGANRLDQINYDFSLAAVHRHCNFPIARTIMARGPIEVSSNLNASDGGRG